MSTFDRWDDSDPHLGADAFTAPKLFIKRQDGGLDIRYGREIVAISPEDTVRLTNLLNDSQRSLS